MDPAEPTTIDPHGAFSKALSVTSTGEESKATIQSVSFKDALEEIEEAPGTSTSSVVTEDHRGTIGFFPYNRTNPTRSNYRHDDKAGLNQGRVAGANHDGDADQVEQSAIYPGQDSTGTIAVTPSRGETSRQRAKSGRAFSLRSLTSSFFLQFKENFQARGSSSNGRRGSLFAFDEATEQEDDYDFKLETDIFSLLFVSRNPGQLYAFLVYFIQILILGFIFFDLTDDDLRREGEEDDNRFNIPMTAEKLVSVSQLLALIIAVVSQDDALVSIDAMFLVDYDPSVMDDYPSATLWWWKFTNFLRWSEGMLTLLLSFTIVGQSANVLDIFMNFAAVYFVSNLDNVAYTLAESGYLGVRLKRNAEAVRKVSFRRDRKAWRMELTQFAFACNLLVLVVGWSVIRYHQKRGSYVDAAACGQLMVAFPDKEFEFDPMDTNFSTPLRYPYFSGEYETVLNGDERPSYVERRPEPDDDKLGRFYYCSAEKAWHFTIPALSGILPEGTRKYCRQGWMLQSPVTDAYMLEDAPRDGWKILGYWGTVDKFSDFSFHCGECSREADCNFHGNCNDEDGRCYCDEGWQGRECNAQHPYCDQLMLIDYGETSKDYVEYGPYRIATNDDGIPVLSYHRPVYATDQIVEIGCGEIVIYTGRRWYNVFACAEALVEARAQILVGNYHAYWSAFAERNTTHFSDPTFKEMPVGLNWHAIGSNRARGSEGAFGLTETVNARFECSNVHCGRNSRVCGVDGKCQVNEDGNTQCKCSNGSGGFYCEYAHGSTYAAKHYAEIWDLLAAAGFPNIDTANVSSIINEANLGGKYYEKYWKDYIHQQILEAQKKDSNLFALTGGDL